MRRYTIIPGQCKLFELPDECPELMLNIAKKPYP